MIGYNLCYSTLLVPEDEKNTTLIPNEEDDVIRSPIHRSFVRAHVRKGVVPLVLEALLQARKRVKQQLDQMEAGGPIQQVDLYNVLNERQKALKVSANAVYGFTGSAASKLLLAELAESVRRSLNPSFDVCYRGRLGSADTCPCCTDCTGDQLRV